MKAVSICRCTLEASAARPRHPAGRTRRAHAPSAALQRTMISPAPHGRGARPHLLLPCPPPWLLVWLAVSVAQPYLFVASDWWSDNYQPAPFPVPSPPAQHRAAPRSVMGGVPRRLPFAVTYESMPCRRRTIKQLQLDDSIDRIEPAARQPRACVSAISPSPLPPQFAVDE